MRTMLLVVALTLLLVTACTDPSDSQARYDDPALQPCIAVAEKQGYEHPAHYCADLHALAQLTATAQRQAAADQALRNAAR